MESDLKTHDIDAYAAIVQRAYGKDAQDFARRMVLRFEGSDTEVELFWKTVEDSLERKRKSQELTSLNGYAARRVTRSLSAILVAAFRERWCGWIAELSTQRRLATRAPAPQS